MNPNIYLKQAAFLLICVLLSACVTTERGGIAKADEKKALETSVQLARSYIQQGNWEAAKRHLKNALELDDSSAEIYEALGLVFQNTGELELAEGYYKKSIDLDGSVARVRNNYAVFLYEQRRYQDAAEQLELVVADTLYEKRPLAYINLGRCYGSLGNLEKARDAYLRAFRMGQRSAGLSFELADVHYQMKEYPIAQQYYDNYRRQVKQQPARALLLGIKLAKVFDNDNAFSSYSLALKNLYRNSAEYLEYKRLFANQ